MRTTSFAVCAWGAALASVALASSSLQAQACIGLPSRGGVNYALGQASFLRSQGVDAAYAMNHFGIGGSYQSIKTGFAGEGSEMGVRLLGRFGISHIDICPQLGISYVNRTRDLSDVSIKSQVAGLRPGLSIGLDQPVRWGIRVIPFVGFRYAFEATYLEVTTSAVDPNVGGDTLTRAEFDYGLTIKYRFAYAGLAMVRNSDASGTRPSFAKWLVGVTWSGNGKQAAPAQSRSSNGANGTGDANMANGPNSANSASTRSTRGAAGSTVTSSPPG